MPYSYSGYAKVLLPVQQPAYTQSLCPFLKTLSLRPLIEKAVRTDMAAPDAFTARDSNDPVKGRKGAQLFDPLLPLSGWKGALIIKHAYNEYTPHRAQSLPTFLNNSYQPLPHCKGHCRSVKKHPQSVPQTVFYPLWLSVISPRPFAKGALEPCRSMPPAPKGGGTAPP